MTNEAGSKKVFRGPGDLAINGAPPALREPLYVGRPNVGNKQRFLSLIDGMVERKWLTNHGPLVCELEEKIAQFVGARHCVSFCNGTVALEVAIKAVGLKDEVIVPSYTFIATAHALQWLGLKPVFADIDPLRHNLDPDAVRRAITPRTTGILAVHLWGRPAPHDALQAIADEHGLKLMYDAAHAFGASLGGRMIGNFGACEVFSFHATKFFNALEGGAIITNDDDLAERVRKMLNFGFAGLDNVVAGGTNGKMNEACAAMGLANLEHLDEIVAVNRRNHKLYGEVLGDIPGLAVLPYDADERCNFQYVVAEVGSEYRAGRDRLLDALRAENVLARRYFWPGCHRMKHYAEDPDYANLMLPNTEKVADRVIVLPTGKSVAEDDIHLIGEIARITSGSV